MSPVDTVQFLNDFMAKEQIFKQAHHCDIVKSILFKQTLKAGWVTMYM